MIELVTFDTSGWRECKEERRTESIVWDNTAGEALSLDVAPVPWKRFQPMERERWLDDARRMAEPGGIVSVDPHVVGGKPAIQIIYKRQYGSGYMYTGIIRVEVKENYYQITVVTGEKGTPGIREAVLTPTLLQDGTIQIRKHPFYIRPFRKTSGFLEGWFQDPYDPGYPGNVLCSVTDSEVYDEQFPDHPLSRLRSTLKTVRDSLRFGR